MGVHAIDVSRWQGHIDWAAVKASGVQGAWIKVAGADGSLYRDSRAAENIAGCTAVGLPFGTYYFCSPDRSPIEQARHAVACRHGEGQLQPLADLETNPASMTHEALDAWLSMFCAEVMRMTSRESAWYGGLHTGVGYTEQAPRHCAVVIANYGRNVPGTTPPTGWSPQVPPAWKRWDAWQHNSVTRIPGISDNTCDQIVVSDEWWAQMLGGGGIDINMEALDMKGVHCPDHTGDVVWDVTMDGYGNRRRRGIGDPVELDMLGQIGALHEVVELRGDLAERFLSRCPEANRDHLADFGALALAMDTKDYVRQRADEVKALIEAQQ
jgi:GH25 family lysozyme M1 (1,4-beta-N-acetylmuramidase)